MIDTRPVWRVLVVAAVLTAAGARRADACICIYDPVPDDNTVEVPVNVRDVLMRVASNAELVLESTAGGAIPLGAPVAVGPPWSYMHLVSLAAPLSPNTQYTVWNDAARLTFRTSALVDEESPGSVGFDNIGFGYIDREDRNSSCGTNRLDVYGRLLVPPDAATLWIRFRHGDAVQERLVKASEWALERIGTSACSIGITLEPDTTYELDVWARDLAGNEGPVTTTSVYIRDAGCSAAGSSSFLLTALSLVGLLIRNRRVAAVNARA